VTVSTTARSPHRRMRGSLAALAACTVVAAGVTALGSLGGGDDGQTRADAPSMAEVLSPLTPEERRYVEWAMSATPEQLAATYGNHGVERDQPPLKPGANLR
jgi:hypothetical protein